MPFHTEGIYPTSNTFFRRASTTYTSLSHAKKPAIPYVIRDCRAN
nr:MAG TPA: hypothetical protein [Caudoviricetes sp.]